MGNWTQFDMQCNAVVIEPLICGMEEVIEVQRFPVFTRRLISIHDHSGSGNSYDRFQAEISRKTCRSLPALMGNDLSNGRTRSS